MANSRRSMGCTWIFFVGGIGSGLAAIIVSSSMNSALEQGGANFYFRSYLPALFLWVVVGFVIGAIIGWGISVLIVMRS
jgi:hypothetical protein